MKLFLESSLFASVEYHLQILPFFTYALRGIHRIEVVEDASFKAWLGKIGELASACKKVIETSYSLEPLQPSRLMAYVADIATSDWSPAVPRLSVVDALRMLQAPFRVMLENGISDRDFLLCGATEHQRSFLKKMEMESVLDYQNGGGLGDAHKRLKQDCRSIDHLRLRTWALFDSDAARPQKPSAASESMRLTCVSERIAHHQLRRRSIENYLTREALYDWATKNDKRTTCEAFHRMTPDQRHHYHMKSGLRKVSEDPGNLYETLASEEDRRALTNGFGGSLARQFTSGWIMEKELKRDGAWDEMSAMVTELVALVR